MPRGAVTGSNNARSDRPDRAHEKRLGRVAAAAVRRGKCKSRDSEASAATFIYALLGRGGAVFYLRRAGTGHHLFGASLSVVVTALTHAGTLAAPQRERFLKARCC